MSGGTSNNDYLSNALDLQFCTNSVKYMEVTVRQIPEFQYEIYDLFYQGTSRTSNFHHHGTKLHEIRAVKTRDDFSFQTYFFGSDKSL